MSSTEKQKTAPPAPVGPPLSTREITALLIKHHHVHDGRYDLMIEFQIGTGNVGPSPQKLTPGIMIGIAQFALIPTQTTEDGPTTVDAAIANPPKKKRSTKNK